MKNFDPTYLELAKKTILAEPGHFDMTDWVYGHDLSTVHLLDDPIKAVLGGSPIDYDEVPDEYECGTACCIGGFAVLHYNAETGLSLPIHRAYEVVFPGLDAYTAWELTGFLFFDSAWPVDLCKRYSESPVGSPERARAAADAIDLFIAGSGMWPEDANLNSQKL